jgi:hypothetical protein
MHLFKLLCRERAGGWGRGTGDVACSIFSVFGCFCVCHELPLGIEAHVASDIARQQNARDAWMIHAQGVL